MKEKSLICTVNTKNEKNREDTGSLKFQKPSDDNSLVEELEYDLVNKNKEIIELQKRLTALGLYNGPISGKYFDQTANAVKKYQKQKGISQTGTVGSLTMNALNK